VTGENGEDHDSDGDGDGDGDQGEDRGGQQLRASTISVPPAESVALTGR
jgi:hypothetical protein